MKIFRRYFLLIIALYPVISFAQINLPIKFVNGYGPFRVSKTGVQFNLPHPDHALYTSMSRLEYRDIPSSLTNLKKGLIWFDFQQFIYQNVIAGNFREEDYQQFKKDRQIERDDTFLSKKPIACYVLIVTGTDSLGNELFFIDSNNDHSFKNEKPAKVPVFTNDEALEDLVPSAVQVRYESMYKNKITKRTLPIILVKNGNNYWYSVAQYGITSIKLHGTIYPIAVSHDFRFPNYELTFVTTARNHKAPQDSITKKNQFLFFGNDRYINMGVDYHTLSLKLYPATEEVAGAQKGLKAIPFSGQDVLTNNIYGLESFKGKFLFIDFWGTWCPPCVAQLPYLRGIYTSLDKQRVAFLGIAGRDDFQKVKSMLNDMQIPWPNIVSDNINQIVEKYHIVSYPTGILIGPDGKVLETDVSSYRLQELLDKHMKH